MKLHACPPPEEPVLVGVSGGRDSVALLHALQAQGFTRLVVCHLDHALRRESAEEARFVAALAARCGCAFHGHRQSVAALAARTGHSLETAARHARLAFFARIARQIGSPHLLLGQHADDQAETFLHHLLRGAGGSGLGAMQSPASHRVGRVTLQIWRPLLGIWRTEIDAYLAQHGLAFREDSSNTDLRHTRNRLRHQILPALEAAFGRPVRTALWRAAEIAQAENTFLDSLLPAGLDAPELDTALLRALPLALQRRALHAWLRGQGVPDLGFEEIECTRSLLDSPRAKINLPGAIHARRRAKKLFLEHPAQ